MYKVCFTLQGTIDLNAKDAHEARDTLLDIIKDDDKHQWKANSVSINGIDRISDFWCSKCGGELLVVEEMENRYEVEFTTGKIVKVCDSQKTEVVKCLACGETQPHLCVDWIKNKLAESK